MKRSITTLLLASAFILATGLTATAADITGTYSWTTAGRNGGPDRKSSLKITKVEGDKVTGTITGGGRGGGRRGGNANANADTAPKAPAPPADIEIKDGKLAGDELTFNTVIEGRNGSVTTKYTGKISGDTIKIKFERPGRQGGAATPVEVEAKKEAK